MDDKPQLRIRTEYKVIRQYNHLKLFKVKNILEKKQSHVTKSSFRTTEYKKIVNAIMPSIQAMKN